MKLLWFSFQKQMEDDVMSLDPANLNESELRPGEDVGMMNNGIKKHEHEIIIIII